MKTSITESEIRSIIRKNLYKSQLQSLLLKEAIEDGDVLKYQTLEIEKDGQKIKVPHKTVQGQKGYIVGANNKSYEFFIPATYVKDKKGTVLFRTDSSESFKKADEDDLEKIKNFVDKADDISTIKDKFDPTKNKITTEFQNIIDNSASDMWKVVTANGGKDFITAFKKEIDSTWGDINNYRARKGLKPIGMMFDGPGANIAIDAPSGKPQYGKVIDEIIQKSTGGLGNQMSGLAGGAARGFAGMMGGKPGTTGDLGINAMTSNDAYKLFKELISGDFGYSYYHFYLLSKQWETLDKSHDFYDYLKLQKNRQMYTSGKFMKLMLEDSALNTIPLFHIKTEGRILPVYAKGDKGYENMRNAMLKNYEKSLESSPEKKKGSEQISQTPEPEVDTKEKKKNTKPVKVFDKDYSKSSGGIRVTVSSDSDNKIGGFDDLGFKSGTDDYIKKELRRLVKNERKFRGTGLINLEILFNKFGRVSKVRFRKGQGKLAARQVERLRSRIKEILGNAKYEEYRTRDEWYQESGVKNKMDPRGKGGKSGSKINMTVKIF
jgi:ribosomal protein L21E